MQGNQVQQGVAPAAEDLDRACRELKQHALGLARAWQELRRGGWTASQLRPVQTATRALERGCERLRLGSLQRRAHDLGELLGNYTDATPDAGQFKSLEAQLSALSSSALALDLASLLPNLPLHRAANEAPASTTPAPLPVRRRMPKTVLVLRASEELARGVDAALAERGFEVLSLATPQQLAEWLQTALPAAAVIDARYLHALGRQIGALKAQSVAEVQDAAVVVVSGRRDLGRKLLAMRNGARAYFEEPFDTLELLAQLGAVSAAPAPRSRRRVLCLAAERGEASDWARWLEDLGAETRVELELAAVEPALAEFAAQVLVADLRHPSGAVLALIEALKSQQRWHALSVVVVGGSNQLAARERSIAAGADEYLLDPVKARHLLSVVKSRIERVERLGTHRPGVTVDGQILTRREVIERAGQAAAAVDAALMFLALDEAEALVNSLGVVGISELDGQLSDVVRRCLEPGDIAAPFHDGAIVALARREELCGVMELAERIRSAVEETRFAVGGRALTLRLSAGLASLADAGGAAEAALKNARAAIAAARHLGGNRSIWYEPHRSTVAPSRQPRLEAGVGAVFDWRRAELRLLFQPLLPLVGRLTGQFLLRPNWRVGDGALAEYPAIETAARRRDQAIELDRSLIEATLEARHTALRHGRQTRLLLDLGAALLADHAFPAWLQTALAQHKLAGPGLTLLFAADTVVAQQEAFRTQAEALRPIGIRIGVDGLVPEHALARQLRGLPVDFVVLAEGLCSGVDLPASVPDAALATLLRRIREAGAVCVATGIERLAQLDALKKLRVDYALSANLAPPQAQIEFDFNRLQK
ncbi:MAG: EAL domain-containing protein [Xanthomonadales bacterium]|jgi:DNA-binding response OmpR family regulator/EAL domain-containing protein (putative c-di-GMP-specific phosphodiesterase class I)|nr:EAL domain-containing protein [Xanthomonadales bacterium]